MTQPVQQSTATYNNFMPGDPAPWFILDGVKRPKTNISYFGGGYVVLGFMGTTSDDAGRDAMETLRQVSEIHGPGAVRCFGIIWTLTEEKPSSRFDILLDPEGSIHRLYGVLPENSEKDDFRHARRRWFVLDPQLRVIGIFPIQAKPGELQALLKFIKTLPPIDRFAGFEMPVPIVAIPFVFEPDLCRQLIQLYESEGGTKTGIWKDIDGMTTRVLDSEFKRRSDITIKDPALLQAVKDRIARRIFPEIEKVHSVKCTRSERFIVGCYDAEDRGFFRPHRDNTGLGAKHRMFAASINLNADFEGGELNFPEYGSKWFKMPPGTAVVFATPLMHQVSPVTKGRRYAFLPFLYDDERAKIREQNIKFVGDGSLTYQAESGILIEEDH